MGKTNASDPNREPKNADSDLSEHHRGTGIRFPATLVPHGSIES